MDPYLCLSLILSEDATQSVSYSTVWGIPSWIWWIVICVLLLVSGLYSASENAYSNCNKYHFKTLASKGNITAKLVTRLVNQFDNTLVTILVGNNIVQTFMSFLSAMLFYNLCAEYGLGDGVEAVLSTVVMALLVYLISDTAPKILSKAIPNKMAKFLAYPVTITNFILYPVIMLFKGILWLVYKIFKIKDESLLSKEDLLHSVNEAINDEAPLEEDEPQEKLFENNEKKLISNVFEFDRLKVKDVYTPLDKTFMINLDDLEIKKISKVVRTVSYSRIPVYENDKNKIVGILVLKKMFEEYIQDPHLDVRSTLEETIYVSPDEIIDDVFNHMNDERVHLAIVKDSNNQTLGIISMEDILEELVDNINEVNVTKGTSTKEAK